MLWSPLNLSLFTNNNNAVVLECIVTVLKNQTILDIKTALVSLLNLTVNPEDIALCEVKNGTPMRLLIDTLSIYLMKDDTYTLYAIQTKITQTCNIDHTDGTTVISPLLDNMEVAVITSGTNNKVNDDAAKTMVDNYDNVITSQMSAGRESTQNTTNVIKESHAIGSLSTHDCAICLETLLDNELLVHPVCGGTLCANCLDILFSKTPEGELTPCPVCSEKINVQSFILYPSLKNYKPETRRLTIPVIFRLKFQDNNNNTVTMKNFPHPFAMEVDNHVTTNQLYTWVTELPRHVLFNTNNNFSLRLLDDTQDSRSIANTTNEAVIIRPSDKIIVS